MKQTIFLTLLLLLFSGCEHPIKQPEMTCSSNVQTTETLSRETMQTELKELKRIVKETGTAMCCQKYIEKVINEGSSVLNLPAGVMDAGYVAGEDVKKVASYVLTLSKREPIYAQYLQEGNMLYNGNCGGCHGDDGKGLGGAYPDLTLSLFEGAKLRKAAYINKIKALETELLKVKNVQ
jgi:cytochrome c553